MTTLDQDHALVVRLDADLARRIVAESEADTVRLAPSLRGVDLAEIGAVILATAGATSDSITLILARQSVSKFALDVWAVLRGRTDPEFPERLSLNLESPRGRLTINLETDDPAKLADALRALADTTAVDD